MSDYSIAQHLEQISVNLENAVNTLVEILNTLKINLTGQETKEFDRE